MAHIPSVLPPRWQAEFFSTADLERSFAQLQGVEHFYAEGLRGRIRSLQLRTADARQHFTAATAQAASAPQTIPNLIRQFVLYVYALDNALLDRPLDPGLQPPELWLPQLPEAALAEYPELRFVFHLRLATEAHVQLHLGEYAAATALYHGLLEADHDAPPDTLASYYLGLAAALHNAGHPEEASRYLSAAGLAIQSGGQVLKRVHLAAILSAFHGYLDHREESDDWAQFLTALPCPQETKDVFLRRGQRIAARCFTQSALVPLY